MSLPSPTGTSACDSTVAAEVSSPTATLPYPRRLHGCTQVSKFNTPSVLRAQMSLRLREVANSSWSNTPIGEYTYIVLKITKRIKNLFGPCVDVYSLYTCNFDYIMYPPKYGLKCLFGYCCSSSNSTLTVSVARKLA